ncbi:MAG TPA: rod shape-determining protein RodA [Chitinophagales bacterium]|nr:rod shape-determining protein RodA [Chitinophagales bacterium]
MRRKSLLSGIDWLTILIYLLLVAMGWFSIYAAEYDGVRTRVFDLTSNHGKQMMWILVSLTVSFILLIIDSKFYPTFSYVIYFLVMLTLAAVLGFGTEVKGNKSWLQFGSISVQPAEFAKFAVNLAIAKYLSTLNVDLRNFRSQAVCLALLLVPMGLIILQGDFGSALVFSAFLLVLFREGLNPLYLVAVIVFALLSILALVVNYTYLIGGMVCLGLLLTYILRKNRQIIFAMAALMVISSSYVFAVDYVFDHFLEAHHRDRINVLLGKSGNDWNVNQSKIAIGSGGWSGKGFLNGTQTKYDFVPELSTDFIFCTIGEEHGFLGSAIVLLLLFGMLFRIIYISERQRSKFSRIYGYGVASILFFHISVNIGMTIGLAPVIGIPLPLFSYGGSSILSFSILLFILLKLDADRLAVLR